MNQTIPSTEERDPAFEMLLNELELCRDRNRKSPIPLRKARKPAPARIVRITRSRHPVASHKATFSSRTTTSTPADTGLSKVLTDFNTSLAMTVPRAATISQRSFDLRKALTDFNDHFDKAIADGALTYDQICLLETHRNNLTQIPLTGLI